MQVEKSKQDKNILLKIVIWVGLLCLEQATLLVLMVPMQVAASQKKTLSTTTVVITGLLFLVVSYLAMTFMWRYYRRQTAQTLYQPQKWDQRATVTVIAGFMITLVVNVLTLSLVTGEQENVAALSSMIAAYSVFFLIFSSVFGPIMEELLFRGFFMRFFGEKWPYLGLVVSSVLFGMTHGTDNFYYLLSKILLGFVLGYSYYRTKNIKVSIAIHILNNTSPLLLALFGL